MKLHISTPYGDCYTVNEKGEITKGRDMTPSGQWKLKGIRNVLHDWDYISFKELTPAKLKTLKLTFRSGHPRYTMVQIDYGTSSEVGNTDVHGIASMYFSEE